MFRRIAVAVDGSEPSLRALEIGIEIAQKHDSSMALITVVPIPMVYGATAYPVDALVQLRESSEQELAKLKKRVRDAGIVEVMSEVREGPPVDQILEFVKEHPTDLLIVGARGLSASRRLLLGSVSTGLVHLAPCPVLVARPGPRA